MFLKFRSNLLKTFRGQSESLFGLGFTSPILPHRRQGKLRLVLCDFILWATPIALWSLLYSYYRTI